MKVVIWSPIWFCWALCVLPLCSGVKGLRCKLFCVETNGKCFAIKTLTYNLPSLIEIIDNEILKQTSLQTFTLKSGGEAVGINV